jgi:ABC-type polysaccharide/polyol phosphate transport system ATPase subunit
MSALGFRARTLKESTNSTFRAISDITFDVRAGERVAVLGRNGAGKTTLLKLIAGITRPSEGSITTRGKVVSVFGVGSGLHSVLTGRENIAMYGTLLGMSRKEIRKRFDDIVLFAGVGEFIDVPMKFYSSGMAARLAFSVASHVEADVLLLDEINAVGDADFQRRSYERIKEMVTGGSTVVMVTHHMEGIRDLCDRALVLDHGRLVADGQVEGIISAYLSNSLPGATT